MIRSIGLLCLALSGLAVSAAGRTEAAPHLSVVQMVSVSTGWGVTSARIFRTDNGWRRGFDVTPSNVHCSSGMTSCLQADFLDRVRAWVAAPSQPISPFGSATIYRTWDGGHTWRSSRVVFSPKAESIDQLRFINPWDGWMWVTLGIGPGQEYFDLYRTVDGGARWDRVYHTGSGDLPHCNCFTGMAFQTPLLGWITGAYASQSKAKPFLFRSSDGGRAWQRRGIPIPAIGAETLATTEPPTFFGRRDGILLVTLATSQNAEFYVYRTTDGGITWLPGTPLPTSRTGMPYDFVTFRLGFAAVGRTLYRTADSGRSWQQITVRAPWSLGQIDFTSSRIGFATGFPDAQGSYPPLLETSDGGEDWSVV